MKPFRTIKGPPFDLSNPAVFASGSKILEKSLNYINGQWVLSNGVNIPVEDPCTNDTIGEVPNFGAHETAAAIEAASNAFATWKKTMPRDRAAVLAKWARLMTSNQEALGNILSRESGKVIGEGVGEIAYAGGYVEWFAGEAERTYGDIIPGPRPGVETAVLRQPMGVLGLITPWNFPAAMITRTACAAIAAGCTVVLKPSELTPFSALALAQMAEEAGLPAGVLNVVTGDAAAIGDTLTKSSVVRKIHFTGSTRVGKLLFRNSADTMKKVGMELGGNAPFIVFEDAELERAANALIACKFRNAGQTCICCNRVLVHASVYDTFKELMKERVWGLHVGNNFDVTTRVGSMISKAAVERMERVVKDAVAKGATVEVGGNRVQGRGYFFEPTVLSNVLCKGTLCVDEEIFGPILPLVKFETEAEAVAIANDTNAGLASYIYTQDYRRQHRVAAALEYGMVGVNDSALSTPCAPFGGVKESGVGRDGSKYGIEPFLDIKYILRSTV